jgi:hypothetical protein
MGDALAKILDGEFTPIRLQALLAGTTLSILGAGIILYPYLASKPAIGVGAGAIIGGLFFGEGLATLLAARKGNGVAMVAGLCIFSYLLGIFGPNIIMTDIAAKKSSKELALLVGRKADPKALIATFGYEQGLPFYAERRVIVVGDRNELGFGSRQGDQSAWFIDLEKFRQLWDGEHSVYALLSEGELAALKGTVKSPITVAGQNRRKVLITNR